MAHCEMPAVPSAQGVSTFITNSKTNINNYVSHLLTLSNKKHKKKKKKKNLSDSMPVNNSSLGEELVGERNVKSVTNFSPNGWPWKLAVDSHHNVFQAIWFSDHVLHIKLVVSHPSSN